MSRPSKSFMQEIVERCITDIMKDNMLNERSRHQEYRNFLKGQIDNYTVEISHKNKQISSLLKLLEKDNIGSCQHLMETIPQDTNLNMYEGIMRNAVMMFNYMNKTLMMMMMMMIS